MSKNSDESPQTEAGKNEKMKLAYEKHLAQSHPGISDRGWRKIWEANQIYRDSSVVNDA